MEKNSCLKRAFLFLSVVVVAIARAQPPVDGFMKGRGNLTVAGSLTQENYGQYYESLNSPVSINRSSTAVSFYSSIGINRLLDFQINIPYIYTASGLSGFQDFTSYLKLAFIDLNDEGGGNFRSILTGGGSIPMSDYNTESLNSIGQKASSADIRLVLQYKTAKGFFTMIQGGCTYRNDPVPSSVPLAVKIGFAGSKHYFDLWYDQQITDEGFDYRDYKDFRKMPATMTDITFRHFGVSYGRVGLTYYKPIKNHGISAGIFQVLWGRNVGQALGISLSIVQHFDLKS